jgi:hypothetical protein
MGAILGLTLYAEHELRVFENRVLRRVFGPKREEVTGGCGKQHNEELHNLYPSLNNITMAKSRTFIQAGHLARMGKLLGRHRHILSIILKRILRKWNGVDWTHVAHDRDRRRDS